MATIDEIIEETAAAASASYEFVFPVAPLIQIAIDLLTKWLGGCFERADRATVEARIAKGDWYTRHLVSRAVKKACRQCDKDGEMSDAGRGAIEAAIVEQAKSGKLAKALDEIEEVNKWLMV